MMIKNLLKTMMIYTLMMPIMLGLKREGNKNYQKTKFYNKKRKKS